MWILSAITLVKNKQIIVSYEKEGGGGAWLEWNILIKLEVMLDQSEKSAYRKKIAWPKV